MLTCKESEQEDVLGIADEPLMLESTKECLVSLAEWRSRLQHCLQLLLFYNSTIDTL